MLGPGDQEGDFEDARCPLCGSGERSVVIPRTEDRLLGHPGTFRICQCAACAVRYLDPRPVGETLVAYYRPRAGKEYPDNQEGHVKTLALAERWVLHEERGYPEPGEARPSSTAMARARRSVATDRETWRWLPWRGSGRLLDVGAGSGSYLAMMRDLGWTVEGTNVVPEAAAGASARFGFPCHVGDLADLALPPASFDAVTLWHVLEHLPDPRAALTKVRGLLAPGGIVGIGVPVYDCVEAEELGDAWLGYDAPRHLFTFDRTRLLSFVQECGFRPLGLHSELRDRILKISYARSDAPAWKKFIMRTGRLRRMYARRLVRKDRIGAVVLVAEVP